MSDSIDWEGLADRVLATFRARGLKVATAESCTGGLISATLTAVAGSSDVVDCGFVTYSNGAKTKLLGVPKTMLARVGAVSEEVARAMAEGALARSHADISVAVTGIAGPGGGSVEKPVGLVHLVAARRGGTVRHEQHVYLGDRDDVRRHTVQTALTLLLILGEGA
jgi:nicotinamide-nucleotide amidase